MALNDATVVKVGTGRFFTAPIGTPRPAELLNLSEDWEDMGHTSIDEILNSSSEGGEVTRLGSLQKRNFKTSVSGVTRSFTINLLQWEEDTLRLAYGSNVHVNEYGDVEIPEVPEAEERAWLFLMFDGSSVGGVYAPRASFIAAEDFSISNTEELTQLPIEVTPVSEGSSGRPWSIIPVQEVEGAEDFDPENP